MKVYTYLIHNLNSLNSNGKNHKQVIESRSQSEECGCMYFWFRRLNVLAALHVRKWCMFESRLKNSKSFTNNETMNLINIVLNSGCLPRCFFWHLIFICIWGTPIQFGFKFWDFSRLQLLESKNCLYVCSTCRMGSMYGRKLKVTCFLFEDAYAKMQKATERHIKDNHVYDIW